MLSKCFVSPTVLLSLSTSSVIKPPWRPACLRVLSVLRFFLPSKALSSSSRRNRCSHSITERLQCDSNNDSWARCKMQHEWTYESRSIAVLKMMLAKTKAHQKSQRICTLLFALDFTASHWSHRCSQPLSTSAHKKGGSKSSEQNYDGIEDEEKQWSKGTRVPTPRHAYCERLISDAMMSSTHAWL